MNNISFINRFADQPNAWQRQAIIAALIACLSPTDACKALGRKSHNDATVRRALLRRVTKDIEEMGCQPYHRALIENLISSFQSLPSNRKQSAGYCLSTLYSTPPSDVQSQIIEFFLTSQYVAMRKRGYKILRQDWNSKYEPKVAEAWKKYRESPCAALIVDHFPDEFLVAHFDDLQEALVGQFGLARLFMRVGADDPEALRHLQEEDNITFAYVLHRLGKTLTPEQAWDMFSKSKFDERIGLLIWCFGQMKLWSTVEKIANGSEQWSHEQHERFRQKYGI